MGAINPATKLITASAKTARLSPKFKERKDHSFIVFPNASNPLTAFASRSRET